MRKKQVFFSVFLLVISCFQWAYAQLGDEPGSEDHPVVSRYPGAYIQDYFMRDYDEVKLPVQYSKGEVVTWEKVAGKHTSLHYIGPKERSTLEIVRNFRAALEASSAEIVFACAGRDCDHGKAYYDMKFFGKVFASEGGRSAKNGNHYLSFTGGSEQQQYLLAKIDQGEKVIFVSVAVIDSKWAGSETLVEVVEVKNMETGLVRVNTEAIRDKITKEGKIALYGILFDTGKATVKPESASELKAVADYLKANTKVNLYIVGHTDDTGNFAANIALSEQRAAAVVAYLTSQLGISPSRLQALGVGPASPVASNDTEAGRAKNRRTELVKKLN